jgi:hypothetical protein
MFVTAGWRMLKHLRHSKMFCLLSVIIKLLTKNIVRSAKL